MAARFFERSDHAAIYSKFRPVPPPSLISRIVNFLQEEYSGPLNLAVDVGCGTGQSTEPLAKFFTNVNGFDVSSAQIKEALQKNTLKNVSFKVNPAETLPFEDESVQLITSAQACHWFDLPKFYEESKRILVQNGVLALYGYPLPHPLYNNIDLHEVFMSAYYSIKGYVPNHPVYWENSYTDSIFNLPFGKCLREDNFYMDTKGSLVDVLGIITSWSGFQKYKEEKGREASQKLLDNFIEKVMETIGEDKKPEDLELTLRHSAFLVMGRKT